MGKLNYALEAEWKKLGYKVPMGSSKLLRPPPARFIRVYHMTNADHAISDISLHRLKLARVADLNDPFELMALNFRNAETRSVVEQWREQYGDSNGLLSFSMIGPVPCCGATMLTSTAVCASALICTEMMIRPRLSTRRNG